MSAYVVETTALRENIRTLRSMLAPQTVFWAVVKGDGYGLGAEPLCRVLLEEGIDHFAAATLAEAQTVRALSAGAEILMLQPSCEPGLLEQLVQLGAVLTVSSMEDAAVLGAVAQNLGLTARAHCKIDTGMGRYGFHPDELQQIMAVYAAPDIAVCGLYTHFSCAFCSQKETQRQFAAFEAVIAGLRGAGIDPGMCHCCNSSAALAYPAMHLDAVRIGSALLGRVNDAAGRQLRRIGWCESSVEELHWLAPGASTGYGAGWRAKKKTCLAIVPVGNFHGFAVEKGRDLFHWRDCICGALSLLLAGLRGKALTAEIRGRRYPVRGHVGMLHTAVDVTGSDVRQGDLVRLEINPLQQKGLPVEYR